jgi:hypothetical protein
MKNHLTPEQIKLFKEKNIEFDENNHYFDIIELLRIKYDICIMLWFYDEFRNDIFSFSINRKVDITPYHSPEEAYLAAIDYVLNNMNLKMEISIRELIDCTYDDEKFVYPTDWQNCNIVYERQLYYDSNEGFLTTEVIVQRKSDNKFFKFSYTEYPGKGTNVIKQKAKEVFPKQKTITVYE